MIHHQQEQPQQRPFNGRATMVAALSTDIIINTNRYVVLGHGLLLFALAWVNDGFGVILVDSWISV